MGGHNDVPEESVPRIPIGKGMRKFLFSIILIPFVVFVPLEVNNAEVLKVLIYAFIGINGVEHVAGVFKKNG